MAKVWSAQIVYAVLFVATIWGGCAILGHSVNSAASTVAEGISEAVNEAANTLSESIRQAVSQAISEFRNFEA